MRRALIVLGLPVLTADYDFWLHPDDCAAFNSALQPLGFHPSLPPEQARSVGRYVVEDDEKADVLIARRVSTVDGVVAAFDEVWARRQVLALTPRVSVAVPCLPDLILTKRFASRPKDAEDIRLLEALFERKGGR